jgi:hypothetical protein
VSIEFEDIRRQHPCSQIVARYCPDLFKKGPQYWALCPFHEDSRPTNFNVYRGKNDIERWRCFRCQDGGDVIDFVSKIEGCTKPEAAKIITGEQMPAVGEFKPKPLPKDKSKQWKPIVPVPADAPPYKPELTYNPTVGQLRNYSNILERMDAYRGSDGSLLFWVVRLRFQDGNKACPVVSFCENTKGERKWCARRMDPPYPLMGLDDLARYPNRYVMVVSGEKCKVDHDDNCLEHKDGGPVFVAVTWLGGDDAVEKADWSPLRGRKWTTFADDDESGRRAMKKLHSGLVEKAGTG